MMIMLKQLRFVLLLSLTAIAAATDYTLVDDDIKCPVHGGTRLFRTIDNQPLTISQCHQLCYNTEGCKYFSYGAATLQDNHMGLCIGCTEEATLVSHTGFESYELTSVQNFPLDPATCLTDTDMFPTNGCDYEAFLDGLDDLLTDEYWRCPGIDAQEVVNSIFSNDEDAARDMVNTMCSSAWGGVPTSLFSDIDSQFTDDFMEQYIDGDTFLNTDTGSFQDTPEGDNIEIFRNDEAINTVVQPIPSLASCSYNSIMCCFGRDRQPDNDGNCKEPLDTKCRYADPADNSNLCWTDTDIATFSDPFVFPEKSEGPIHCHGLAWGDDENSFTDQLKFNNFFYVSLFDHMYTRGYVETMVDSDNIPMCDCIENMPVVSRADCTQVDATQEFSVSYKGGSTFEATKVGDLNVEFNRCKGTNPGNGKKKNNDLGSYVYRLNQEGRLSDVKKNGVFDTLYGYATPNDNQNEAGCVTAFEQAFPGESYPDNVANLKCPFGSEDRLFRTEDNDPLTLEECQDMCYETDSCEYFSLGLKGKHFGVCIGCTSDAVLETHNGINSYQLTSTKTSP